MHSTSSDPKPSDPPTDGEIAEGAGPAGDSGEGGGTVHEEIAALQAEATDFKDKWLRAHAEMENIRKRAEKEKEDTAKYAISKLARDLVGVGDNFQRAVEAIPAGAADEDLALKSFIDGVTMIERELFNALERHGIKRMQPLNEPFSPHLHQAVMEIPRSDVAAGTIVKVFQPGYLIEERVLRPAMVGVAKGGPRLPIVPEDDGPGRSANEDAPASGRFDEPKR